MHCNSLKKCLRVMHWNAQGITTEPAVSQLELFVHKEKIDIILLNETFLKPKHKFKISKYKVYREDRKTHGGGVLIAILESIDHKLLPKYKTSDTENISISIKINGRTTIITSAYNPHYTNKFKDDIEILTNISSDFFIFGDLNAHHTSWNCQDFNPAGNVLYNHQLQSNYYVYFPSSFTRFGQNLTTTIKPSTVDILLSNSSLSFSTLQTYPFELNSDHVPVICNIYGNVYCTKIKVPLYHQTNWTALKSWVTNELSNQQLATQEINMENVDLVLKKLTNIVQSSFEKIPTGDKNEWQREISDLSKYLISQRNKFRRKLQRCNDNRKAQLKAIVKQLNNLINFHLNKDRNEKWSKFISNLPTGSKKFWKISKAIKGNRTSLADLTINGEILKTNDTKANAIADVFEKSHTLTLNYTSPLDRRVNRYIQNLNNNNDNNVDHNILTNIEEIKAYVFLLKNKKAPGLDGINSIILKNMPDLIFEVLASIFNCCIRNGYFPSIFKKAKVIPVPKKDKDPHLPSSYRPISILSLLDKIFEKIIQNRLLLFTDSNNIINKEQFGFRRQHSTVHQLRRVVKIIDSNKRNRHSTGIVFLDIEKAFDSIWHDGLLYKLNTFGYPIYLQKLIKSFLSERNFVVSVDNCHSSTRNILAGLPQGSVLSPTLYSIFTSDFVVLKNQDAAFYADDSALICNGKVSNAIIKRLQKSLNSAQRFFDKWKIKLNQEKTNAIIFPFNKSPKRIPTIPLVFQGNVINIDDDIKYLGLILDKKLTFGKHVKSICEKAIRCGRALYPLLNRKSTLNRHNKTLLYKMCILPIMTYSCQVWYNRTAKSHTKKLQVIQNKNLKIIHNLKPRYSTSRLHNRFGHKTVNNFIQDLNSSFNERCMLSDFDIIRNLL